MAEYKAKASPELVDRERMFVRGQGWTWTEKWRGRPSDIFALKIQFAQAGWDVELSHEQPYASLTATRQATSQTNNQEFFDRFRFSFETIEKDLFTLDAVQQEVELVWTPNTGDNMAGYRDIIESAVEDGSEDLLPDQGTYPNAWKVYRELSRGAEAFESEYLVLTRERVVGINFRADPMILRPANTAKIYTTAQLKSQFRIPDISGISFPDETVYAPPNTKWGWRSRRHEARFLEGLKVELVQDWAFAAWSLFLYEEF